MLDNWSTDATVYRRGAIGSKSAPHDHNGQDSFRPSDTGKAGTIAEFDQARVLAGSLPAAAAEIILRRTSSYIAKDATGTRCTTTLMCVDIYRKSKPNAPFIREEEWLISRETGLPTIVDLILPNLTGTKLIFEEFTFEQHYCPATS